MILLCEWINRPDAERSLGGVATGLLLCLRIGGVIEASFPSGPQTRSGLDSDSNRPCITSSPPYLQLKNQGSHSFVGFSQQGDTLVNMHQLTDASRVPVDAALRRLRELQGYFPDTARSDLAHILRQVDRLCELLIHQHDADEAQKLFAGVGAQIEAMAASSQFQGTPASLATRTELTHVLTELQSFVSGKFRLSSPGGILTQDGINLTNLVDLPAQLKLGIGFLFNLDLCGERRFSLNAARDAVILDDRAQQIFLHLYAKIGEFLGDWFVDAEIPPDQVAGYLDSIPRPLAENVKAAFEAKYRRLPVPKS